MACEMRLLFPKNQDVCSVAHVTSLPLPSLFNLQHIMPLLRRALAVHAGQQMDIYCHRRGIANRPPGINWVAVHPPVNSTCNLHISHPCTFTTLKSKVTINMSAYEPIVNSRPISGQNLLEISFTERTGPIFQAHNQLRKLTAAKQSQAATGALTSALRRFPFGNIHTFSAVTENFESFQHRGFPTCVTFHKDLSIGQQVQHRCLSPCYCNGGLLM